MYKRIAVAVDGSASSALALAEAIKLARTFDSTLLLLHVCEETPVMWQPDSYPVLPLQEIMQAFVAVGRALLENDSARVSAASVAVESKLVEDYSGRIGAVIVQEANNWAAELLVMGTHGRKGFQHLLMGSVAESAVRLVTMPVLMVPSHAKIN